MVENLRAWIRQNIWTKLEADARYYTRAAADILFAAHAALTAAHGATGAVVGTTNSQTLTNKTLTSPTINTPTFTGDISAALGQSIYVGGPTPGGVDGVRLHYAGGQAYIDVKDGDLNIR